VVEVTRTEGAPELPALVRRRIADAIRAYYEACERLNGPACEHVVLHSEVDDPKPLTALLIVVPESRETAAWIESVNNQAAHSWDTLQDWARVLGRLESTRDSR
jgi:hypothetical protein